jgi:hypothetical protein
LLMTLYEWALAHEGEITACRQHALDRRRGAANVISIVHPVEGA